MTLMSFFRKLFRRRPKLLVRSERVLSLMTKMTDDPKNYSALLQTLMTVAAERLQFQLAVCLETEGPLPRPHDRWVVGYLFGFCDGFFQHDIEESAGLMAMTIWTLCKLYDEKTGCAIAADGFNWQHDNDGLFNAGMWTGGDDAVKYLRDKEGPMSLVWRFHERREHLGEYVK